MSNPFTAVAYPMTVLLNPADFETVARERLPQSVYDYYAGGAGDEITIRENVAAWSRVRLLPRVLVDVGSIDLRTTVLGQALSMPIITAPCALNALAHPDGELAVGRAVAAEGTMQVLSTLSSYALEEVAASSPAPRWFQLYVYRDREITRALVQRVERAEVFVDGGIRRGTDVLKALAMGARAVLIGRPYLWGLSVDGERGVRRVLALLREDLALSMALAGTRDVSDLSPGLIG